MCQSHEACFASVGTQVAGLQAGYARGMEQLERRMGENADKLNRLLDRSEQWLVNTTAALTEIAAMKQDLVELRHASIKQWEAINGLRRTVYTGVGIALAVSALLPLALKLLK